jgi:phosphoenolpyruvate carboxykinase (GTP)
MLDSRSQRNLEELNNEHVTAIVKMAIELCKPDKVTVLTDSQADMEYVRNLAIKNGEEQELSMAGHTVHFDGYYDQGRDKAATKYLLSKDVDFGLDINSMDRDEGLEEIKSLLDGSMRGKEMLVRFYCLGPVNSEFSIPALQITDSAYVAHSEDLLYRPGYEEFKRLNGSSDFFYFIHSAGRLENGVCVDVDKRRVYIDLQENRVFSVNTQYAGNTVGLKKLALRLAIKKASGEGWLAEHMFVMGVRENNGEVTYFTGAFPTLCESISQVAHNCPFHEFQAASPMIC